MHNHQKKEDECCPKFDPTLWDEKTHEWREKKFIKETKPQFLHMPIPGMIGKMMTRMWNKIEKAGADPKMKDFLWLAYDPSPWKGEHYIYVTKEVPDAENVTISGTFISKVYDGPYNNVPKWLKDLEEYLSKQDKKAKKYYFYYTTCPRCAKKWGHNYVVAFAQIK